MSLHVVFYELQRLARSRIVAINVGLLPKLRPQQRVNLTTNNILSNVLYEFGLVFYEVVFFALFVVG